MLFWELQQTLLCATQYHPRYGSKKFRAPEHHTSKHCCGGRAARLLTSLQHKLEPSQTSKIHGPHRKVKPPRPNPGLCHRSPPGAKRPGGGAYEHLGVQGKAVASKHTKTHCQIERTEWKHLKLIFYASSLIPQICLCLHSLQLSCWYLARKSAT